MTDNIIKFPNKDETKGSEEEPTLLTRITIYDDGTLSVWVSQAVEDPIVIDYLKEMTFNAVTTVGSILEDIDDRYVETTSSEKDLDEVDNDN